MELMQWIISIGAVIGAIISIWKAIVTIVHTQDAINEIKTVLKEVELSCLRLTVISNDMPVGERIVAGKKYLDKNGNGDVKKLIEEGLHAKDKIEL